MYQRLGNYWWPLWGTACESKLCAVTVQGVDEVGKVIAADVSC